MSVLWIIGAAKSGKSELAEEIFSGLPGKKFYVGTLPRIPKWLDTIKKHADWRPKEWELIEITDKLDMATGSIERSSNHEVVATLLDGWGVYVERRASQWGQENMDVTMVDETRFVGEIYSEYCQSVGQCLPLLDRCGPYIGTGSHLD